MSHPRSLRSTDDRGVSTAVTHVLALGITAILISGLLLAAAGLLGDQRQNATDRQLETIGNRLASQIMEADESVDADNDGISDSVTLRIEQPARIAGQTYTVNFERSNCTEPVAEQPTSNSTNACLTLFHDEVIGDKYQVPLELDAEAVGPSPEVLIDLQQTGTGDFVIVAEET